MPGNSELERIGIKLVVYPQDILAATVHAVRAALGGLKGGAKDAGTRIGQQESGNSEMIWICARPCRRDPADLPDLLALYQERCRRALLHAPDSGQELTKPFAGSWNSN
jgi:hypothetical protein